MKATPSCFNFYLQPNKQTSALSIILSFFSSFLLFASTPALLCSTCYASFLSLRVASLYLCISIPPYFSSMKRTVISAPWRTGCWDRNNLVFICFILFPLVPQWAEVYGTLRLAGPCLQCYFYACVYLHVRISVCTCMQIWDYFQTGHKYPWWPKYTIYKNT